MAQICVLDKQKLIEALQSDSKSYIPWLKIKLLFVLHGYDIEVEDERPHQKVRKINETSLC